MRFLCVLMIGSLAAALAQQEPPPPPAEQTPETRFTATVSAVVAPVLVTDRDGNTVDGLPAGVFRLFDNGKEQDIKVDVAFQPISVVIAVQANAQVYPVLPTVQKIGSLIQGMLIGEQGEAAVLAFDHRLQLLQEFTSDSDKIAEALKKIKPGSRTSRMVDAVNQGVNMLRTRPQNRRRIILLISETRDSGSEGRSRDTLIAAQLYNVNVYSVNISRLVTTLLAKPEPARPNRLPPAARGLPPGVPATPTAVQQTYGGDGGRAEFLPLMLEIFRDVKAIFKSNPVELFTRGTGGGEFAFVRQRGLEEAIQRIGTELRSQYLITYVPNNRNEGGFHEITLEIAGRRDLRAHTRPGYWLAPSFQ